MIRLSRWVDPLTFASIVRLAFATIALVPLNPASVTVANALVANCNVPTLRKLNVSPMVYVVTVRTSVILKVGRFAVNTS